MSNTNPPYVMHLMLKMYFSNKSQYHEKGSSFIDAYYTYVVIDYVNANVDLMVFNVSQAQQ